MSIFSLPGEPATSARRADLLIRLPHDKRWEGYLNSEAAVGLLCHYVDGNSEVCTQTLGKCLHCTAGSATRWRGYIGFVNLTIRRHHVLELTEGAYALMGTSGLWTPGESVRGLYCEFWRHEGKAQGRMMVSWRKDKRAPFRLNEPYDLKRVVTALYQVSL